MTVVDARPGWASTDRHADRSPDGGRSSAFAAWLLVAAAVAWNLVRLRATLTAVPYLDDASVHEQMVRVATAQLRAGHLPLTSWFPYLGEGSPQFLHYQSLPAILTGAVGLLVGPNVAFRWSLYLLWSLWPVSVYLAARWFGGGRPAAAASAAMAPFLNSVPGVGYEAHAYVWIGYGVWTQLWASWTLPLAWGAGWRAIRTGTGWFSAVLFTAATVALHFETGYLALAVYLLWPWVAGRPVGRRVLRSALVLAGALAASAWVFVPVLAQSRYAAVNEPLRGTGLVDGYGARQVLEWLVTGGVLDHGRLPVVTALGAVGLAVVWLSWFSDVDGRALLVVLGLSLLLSFGPHTFGSLADVVPGAHDLFFRRFMMGVQLSGLLLAGRGAAWLAGLIRRAAGRASWTPPPFAWAAAGLACAVVVLIPAWTQLDRYAALNARAIDAQRTADATQGAELDRIIARIRADGGGRTYAGAPTDFGATFDVGQVPVFKYLESRDVDEVGYTLRTASLMTDPEYYFDDAQPADDVLFAVHSLILPAGMRPPVPATRVMRAGDYVLWRTRAEGYLHAGEIVGRIAADRFDVGVHSISLLQGDLATGGGYLAVHDRSGPAGELVDDTSPTPAGSVSAERVDLAAGRASAVARMRRPGVVVLSASYDPGWRVTVDGRRRPARWVAPALVAVDVPAGTSRVTFRYVGFPDYLPLFSLAIVALVAAAAGSLLARRRTGRDRS